jgi:putative tricarboxylic transport membrane protein
MAFGGMREWISGKDGNLWTSVFLLIFSGGVAIEAYRLGLGGLHSPGPGFMLFGASSLLGLLSLQQFLKFLMARRLAGKNTWVQKHWRRVILVLVSLTIYNVLLNKVGYLLTTFFLLVFLFRILGSRKWVLIVGGAALISLLTYLVFSLGFELYFPKGLIPFL